jgi:hypothetical protein
MAVLPVVLVVSTILVPAGTDTTATVLASTGARKCTSSGGGVGTSTLAVLVDFE